MEEGESNRGGCAKRRTQSSAHVTADVTEEEVEKEGTADKCSQKKSIDT